MKKNNMFAFGEQHILDHTKDAALYVLGRMNEEKNEKVSMDYESDSATSRTDSRSNQRVRVLGARIQYDSYTPDQKLERDTSISNAGTSPYEEVSRVTSTSGVSFVLVVVAVLALIALVAVVTVGILHIVGPF